MLVLATILFILLSPGLILTLDPTKNVWTSEETSNLAVIVHGALFFTVLKLTHDKYFVFQYLNDLEAAITGAQF